MKILLGVCDEKVDIGEITSSNMNKIGGQPDWPLEPIPIPLCDLCQQQLLLIVQIYCPLETFPHHRTLYVFSCTSKTCWYQQASWKVLRCQMLDASYEHIPDSTSVSCTSPSRDASTADTWGLDDADWGDDDDDIPENTMVTTQTVSSIVDINDTVAGNDDETIPGFQQMAIDDTSSPTENERACSSSDFQCTSFDDEATFMENDPPSGDGLCIVEDIFLDQYRDSVLNSLITDNVSDTHISATVTNSQPVKSITLSSYYINVFDEPEDIISIDHEHQLLLEYMRREKVEFSKISTSSCKGGGEKYEQGTAKHGDKIFQKFQKRICRCSEQILRYCYKGEALDIQTTVHKPPPACLHCGTHRVFECQLMPAAVNWLKFPGRSESAVEFGTVQIYTCGGSCWNNDCTFREECIIVHAGPDEILFKS